MDATAEITNMFYYQNKRKLTSISVQSPNSTENTATVLLIVSSFLIG